MGLVAAIAVLFVAYVVVGMSGIFTTPPQNGSYDDFAKCLTQKGIIMAGTDWCSHCNDQKNMFGKSFQYINFKNCDQGSWCSDNGITGYPTWVFPDGQKYPGVQTFQKLSELSGCSLT